MCISHFSQNYLQLNHMSTNNIQMLPELLKAWFHDHFPGYLLQWLTTLWVKKAYRKCPIWTSSDTASLHFFLSYQSSSEKERSEPPPPLSTLRKLQSMMKLSLNLFFFTPIKTWPQLLPLKAMAFSFCFLLSSLVKVDQLLMSL